MTITNDSYSCASGGVIAGGRHGMSAFWAALSPGWTELRNATTMPWGIVSFSSFAVDSQNGKIYFFGGGHRDYHGNDVWEFNLETRSEPTQHYAPYPLADASTEVVLACVDDTNYPGAVIAANSAPTLRPISRHTYSSVVWMPPHGKLAAGGGSTYSGSSDQYWGTVYKNDPRDWWTYDPIPKTWAYKGSRHLDAAFDMVGSVMAYSTVRDRVFGVATNGNGNVQVREWNPNTNLITLKSGQTPGGYDYLMSTMDTTRNRLIIVARYGPTQQSHVFSYDPTADTMTQLTTSGTNPGSFGQQNEIAYNPDKDCLYMLGHNATQLARLNMTTLAWSHENHGLSNFVLPGGTLFYDEFRKVLLMAYINSTVRIYTFKEPA